jgi:hypothetical protein
MVPTKKLWALSSVLSGTMVAMPKSEKVIVPPASYLSILPLEDVSIVPQLNAIATPFPSLLMIKRSVLDALCMLQ